MSLKKFSILQVSTADIAGGAEKIAWNLFQAYCQQRVESWLAVGRKKSKDPHVLQIPNEKLYGKWAQLWRNLGRSFEGKRLWIQSMFYAIGQPKRALEILAGHEDFNFPGTWRLLELTPKPPGIIHCHNLHGGYFDLQALPWLSQQVPVVMTLHDIWLLSGHCAYSFNCERWKTGCGQCPDLSIYPAIKRDATAHNWRRKRDIYAKTHLYVATPSRWLMEKVEQSILAPAIIESRVIPNGVDLSIFKPSSKSKARRNLNLPQDTTILLSIGNRLKRSPFKNHATIEETLKKLGNQKTIQKLLLLCVGDEGPDEHIGKAMIRFAGYQEDPKRVAMFYQAADIFLHAAKIEADTFPTTILEALACGTPVVATAVGGIPEQIEDGVTGFLVPQGDAAIMASRIEQLLSDDELRRKMSAQAAKAARSRFNLEHQVSKYLNWYKEILEDWQLKKGGELYAAQP